MYTATEIKKKLANYCSYQERCHSEIEKKLNEFYFLNGEEKGDIIIWLIQNNFLNEERFALSYTRSKFYIKKWGKIKIKVRLKQKKIPEKLILLSFKEIDKDDYTNTLKSIAQKKWNLLDEASIFNKKKKLISYLSQKGYEIDLIYDFLDSL